MSFQVYTIDNCLLNFEIYPGEIFPESDIIPIDSNYYHLNRHQFRFVQGKKIAVVWCKNFTQLSLDLSAFDLVVVFSKEWHDKPNYRDLLIDYYKNPNLLYVNGDQINDPNTFMVPWMLFEIVAPFNEFKSQNYSDGKKIKFDILLGRQKTHRDYLFNQLQQSPLLRQSFVNYTTAGVDKYNNLRNESIKPIYRTPKLSKYELEPVRRQLKNHSLFHSYMTPTIPMFQDRDSNYVPWEIYANSNYTIVAETNGIQLYYNPDHFFPTEKTAKPLFAKRPFVVFSSANYLHNLRRLGFETFGSVIDESYDDIINDVDRWAAAWQATCDLAQQNPETVYKKLHRILEHNHQKVQDRGYFIGALRDWIYGKISKL